MKNNSKRLFTGALAFTMAMSSLPVLPIQGLAAEDEQRINSIIMKAAAGDSVGDETYTEHPEKLEDDARAFIDKISELYGIDKDATELTESSIYRFKNAVYTDDAQKDALYAAIDEIQAMYAGFSDEIKLLIAVNCPARLAAYASIENNRQVADIASMVAQTINKIDADKLTIAEYNTQYNAIVTANTVFIAMEKQAESDPIYKKAVEILAAEGYAQRAAESEGLTGKLGERNKKLDELMKEQTTTFENAVNAVGDYTQDNFLEKSSLISAAKDAWKAIKLDVLANKIQSESKLYERYVELVGSDSASGLEAQYIKEAKSNIATAYRTAAAENNKLESLDTRKENLEVIAAYEDRFKKSVYEDYREYELEEEIDGITKLGDIFNAYTGLKNTYDFERDLQDKLDKYDEIVDTYDGVKDFTQEQIDADYKTVCDYITEAEEKLAACDEGTTKDNEAKLSERVGSLKSIKTGMETKAKEYLDGILAEITRLKEVEDKLDTAYIDDVNKVNRSVEGTLSAVRDIAKDQYELALKDVAELNSALKDVIDTATDESNKSYADVITQLNESGLRYDTDDVESCKTTLSSAREKIADRNDELEIIRYYKENTDPEYVLPDVDSATKACDSYEQHINDIEKLRELAADVKAKYEDCSFTLDDGAREDFDELYEFIKDNYEGSNDEFSADYAVFATAMDAYVLFCNEYTSKYAEEEFENNGGLYVDANVYNKYPETSAYVNEYLSTYYSEASSAATDFIEWVNRYYNDYTSLAEDVAASANEQYAADYERVKGLNDEYAEITAKWTEIGLSSSRYFIDSSDVTEKLTYANEEKQKWEEAIAYTDKINAIRDVYDTRAVNKNYETGEPDYFIPTVQVANPDPEGAPSEVKIDEYADTVLGEFTNTYSENQYVSSDAIESLNGFISGMKTDKEYLESLKAKSADVAAWKTSVDTVPMVDDISKLDESVFSNIKEYETKKLEIDADEEKRGYANKAEGADTEEYTKYTDKLAKYAQEYRKTAQAKVLDDKISGIDEASDSGLEAGRAAFEEVAGWFAEPKKYIDKETYDEETYGEEDIIDIIIRMPNYSKYNTLKSYYYDADIRKFVEAVAAVGDIDLSRDFEEVERLYNAADALYNGLTEAQQAEPEVIEAKAVLDSKVEAYMTLQEAYDQAKDVIDLINTFDAAVDEYISDGTLTVEGYQKLESDYAEIWTEIEKLRTEQDDVSKNACEYLEKSGCIARAEAQHDKLNSTFAHVAVADKIEKAYAAYQANKESDKVEAYGRELYEADCAYALLADKTSITNYGKLYAVRTAYDKLGYGDLDEVIKGLEHPTYETFNTDYEDIALYIACYHALSSDNLAALKEALNSQGEDPDKMDKIETELNQYATRGGKPGDINDDGTLNILDITSMVGVMLSDEGHYTDLGQRLRSDYNWDGTFADDDIIEALENIEFSISL